MLPSKELGLLSIFAFAICLIAANPSVQSGESIQRRNESTKITDLNDDVLYGTFAYSDLEDFDNLVRANERLALFASHLFYKRSIEFLNDWRRRQRSFELGLESDARKLIRIFTPRDTPLDDLKIVLLFKFLSFMGSGTNHNISIYNFESATKSYVETMINKSNNIEEFAKILTPYDHSAMLRYVSPAVFCKWSCYTYMLILEKSKKHLKNQFTYAMMLKMDEMRNAANAVFLRQHESNSTSSTLEYRERFPLDWDLYKGETPSEDTKGKFHSNVAKKAVGSLNLVYFWEGLSENSLQHFVRTYCAIRSLTGSQFGKLVDDLHINLAIFDLSTASRLVRKLRQSLETVLKGTTALETGLTQQIKNLNKLIGGEDGGRIISLLYRYRKSADVPFYSKVVEVINEKVERLANSTDFGDYVKLLKTLVLIAPHQTNGKMEQTLRKLYTAYFTFVNRPSAFDDADQLNEVDRLHTKLFNHDPMVFRSIDSGTEYRPLVEAAFKNFDSILLPRITDTPEIRTKQRIILKMLIFLTNAYTRETRGEAEIENVFKVMRLFYALAQSDGETLSKDSSLLRLWNHLQFHTNPAVVERYEENNADEVAFLYQPYELTGVMATDAFVYLCHLNAATHLTISQSISNQTLENILKLEEAIGDAETTEPFLRAEILDKKFQFYHRYGSEVKDKLEKDHLKKFVESMIDLLLNQDKGCKIEFHIFCGIFNAVKNSRETVKEQLGDELIERLSELSYDNVHAQLFTAPFFKQDHELFNQILGI